MLKLVNFIESKHFEVFKKYYSLKKPAYFKYKYIRYIYKALHIRMLAGNVYKNLYEECCYCCIVLYLCSLFRGSWKFSKIIYTRFRCGSFSQKPTPTFCVPSQYLSREFKSELRINCGAGVGSTSTSVFVYQLCQVCSSRNY